MSGSSLRASSKVLAIALLALVVLFVFWFRQDKHVWAAMLIFALPPLLMLAGVLRGNRKAAFWAGVFGLFWFSHGVMVAYSRPAEAGHAWTELLLALVIVLSSSWPGLSGRFKRKQPPVM